MQNNDSKRQLWSAGVVLALVLAGAARAGDQPSSDDGAREAPLLSTADAQRAAVVAVIQHWIDAVNRQDVPAVSAPWTPDAAIIDSLPPYQWQGPQAVATWWADYAALAASQGLTEITFEFDSRYIDVGADAAYVVGDAHVDYRLKTGSMRDVATWTFCLARRDDQWLLTAWAWGHRERVATATSH